MDTILQGLMELSGVRAAMVLDGVGKVVARRGLAIYDGPVCERVGSTVTKAIESIQLQQQDWDTITAQFADGRILLRRVNAAAAEHVLAVVADTTLNASFATVALRVAANKIKGALDGTGSYAAASSAQPPGAASSVPASSSVAPASESRPVLANTGLSWSKSSTGVSDSGTSISGVAVADAASGAFLTRCTKQLARHVGPIAKVYVQEAVRRVSPDAPFALARARQLVDDLGGQIEDADDRAQFRKAALEK